LIEYDADARTAGFADGHGQHAREIAHGAKGWISHPALLPYGPYRERRRSLGHE
jgi:hypothetical protein